MCTHALVPYFVYHVAHQQESTVENGELTLVQGCGSGFTLNL